MKVGLIVPGFSADADDWCIPALRNFVQHLSETDDVRVVALRYPNRVGHYEVFGARVFSLGGGLRRHIGAMDLWRRTLSTVLAEHRREPFDVLHAFWATESGQLTAIAGRMLQIPAVVSLAGGELVGLGDIGYGDQLWWRQRLKVAIALRLADIVTAGSEYLLNLARPWLHSRSVNQAIRVPLGVDTYLFRPETVPAHVDSPRVVHIASLTPVKDQAALLAAVARLRDDGIAPRLEIAGSGPLEQELRSLARELRIEDLVKFRGEIAHHLLPHIYQRDDIFVLNSRHEAQGMAALEAAACGVPVVGTPVGIVPELAPDAALVAASHQPGALADAIGRLLTDPVRRRAMGRSARELVEREFGVPRCVERFRKVYETAASIRRHVTP